MTCLSSVKFAMRASVLRKETVDHLPDNKGEWQEVFDFETGEEKQVWVEFDADEEKPGVQFEVDCLVKANLSSRFDNSLTYRDSRVIETEYLTMTIPGNIYLYTTDRVTNVRNNNRVIYFDDTSADRNNKPVPATFNVNSVSPVTDPFGNVREHQILLKKANSGG